MATPEIPSLVYREGPETFSKIELEIDRLWDVAAREAPFQRIHGMKRTEAIWIKREAGIIAEAAAVIVFFQPAINEIAKDVWREFILPRLKKRFGDDVLEEVRGEDGSAARGSGR